MRRIAGRVHTSDDSVIMTTETDVRSLELELRVRNRNDVFEMPLRASFVAPGDRNKQKSYCDWCEKIKAGGEERGELPQR